MGLTDLAAVSFGGATAARSGRVTTVGDVEAALTVDWDAVTSQLDPVSASPV